MAWNNDRYGTEARYAVNWRRLSELLAVAISGTVWMLFLIRGG